MDDVPERNKLKIILLGDSAVGKSKLIERFLLDKYRPQQSSTYALSWYRYEATVGTEKILIDFWDTAGQDTFNSVHPSYYQDANACILCFDVTRKITYQNMKQWYAELQEHRAGIPVCVAANKIDMDMKAAKKAYKFPEKHHLPVYFVSASNGINVVKLFQEAIQMAFGAKDTAGDESYNNIMRFLREEFHGDELEDDLDTSTPSATPPAALRPGPPPPPASATQVVSATVAPPPPPGRPRRM
ncbi:putative Rabl2a protein [Paratrimastix pyriformis]|uniref:Rabl2a protein n=1 Tax=Paratrimastix pyriformis TaxID=342808 RepID=A0ABQ8ULU1_9EUKA|nr:putative Rabl2a protein [Paratrimastix pyriformis]|eukprot:GAFH01004145.1.p1 GENE.GAFH01004145.1~~GAFH01004145.1.p1  ORF type:complete len:243 (-),score=28.17 GAFH01004145.1:100-828(-)